MKYLALSLALIVPGCQAAAPSSEAPSKALPRGSMVVAGELPARGTEIDQTTTSSCSKPLYCGAVGYVDCGSAADGPAYYFDRKTGKIIGACGGYCMYDPQGTCKKQCPPPAWTCRKR